MPSMAPLDGGMRWVKGPWVVQPWGLSWLCLVIMLLTRLRAKVQGSYAEGGQPQWRSAGRHCDRAWQGAYDSCRVNQGSPSFLRLRAPAR